MEEAVSLSGSNMLTSHLVSLDLALALRDAGYPQSDSLFIWTRAWTRKGGTLRKDGKWYIAYNQYHGEGNLAAPLASEILEVLPRQVHGKYLNITKAEDDGYYVTYGDGDYGGEHKPILANALGKLFLHLRKASLI